MQGCPTEAQGFAGCAKATEIQSYADSNNTKHFYDAFKQEHSSQHSGTSQLVSADGTTLLIEKGKILEEHFSKVLNQPPCITDEVI